MSTRDAFREHLTRGDLEGALQLIEPHLPGVAGSATRVNNLSGARALLRWAQDEWRSILHPDTEFGEAYLQHLTSKHGAETSSIQNRLIHARNTYKALIASEIVTTNPFAGLKGPNHKAEEHRQGYTQDEIERLCQHASPEGKSLVLLGAHAGLTGPELRAVKWTDINFKEQTITVSDRIIPLSKELHAALSAYHTGLFSRSERLFELPTQLALREHLFTLCQRAQVWYGDKAIRALRAYAGERFYALHEDRELVARYLGVRSAKTHFTLRNYARRKALEAQSETHTHGV
ncbi:site-specific integrase [Deinococcus peraridilitoris]|uniref:Tyr recombinase domain-containing protein n=1 Tax=Deinococcus peraridilitoris (strain DSM 19664 / LMG 22246 / CIP 109416 / KR-200) TaxID=937777 RepID=L0A7E8_DEIPD|nr:site-specific integrase [Deinococcus peraridilitoris]AFZ69793.1 hypothetical protein Deipe_4468 [Deinococcus peraridilitoris DSM 19664]